MSKFKKGVFDLLQIKNITKKYSSDSFEQVALNDVSINFRSCEFVSILGQSGSGKTTLLNIIGGLDKYDSGDLIINGVSTKQYKDRDWDSYRNHSIGFVFQSYNLIGHQSILSNVEMALTLSGVNKKERKKRAIEALEKVGLTEHIRKRPNQLSGGQMQRVAIARALVNNPDIILADEPTGALDSETSVQIMDLLKQIAKEKLVIMVTHNPELAEMYSTRIIRVRDGYVTSDTNPYYNAEKDLKKEKKKEKKKKKPSMSFFTALGLSLNNLMTKKGRTVLTSFAGSIGIIGIALILAISTGVNNYIDSVQQDTLSSYPISIFKENTDMSALMSSMMGIQPEGENVTHGKDAVYANPIMFRMMKQMMNAEVNKNNLEAFKKYLEEHKDELAQYTTAIQYGYDIDLNIYAKDPNNEYAKADFIDLMNNILGGDSFVSSMTSYMDKMGSINIWQELITDPSTGEVSSLITDKYDLIYGKWPTEANEILLVLTENNEISDLTLYALGLVDRQTMMNATMAAMTGKEDTGWDDYVGKSWSYEEICNIPLKLILPTDYYKYDESLKLWVNISDNDALLNTVIENGLELKVSGIVRPNEDATATMLTGSLCYTSALTKYYVEGVANSQIIKEQMSAENANKNIISGLPFFIDVEEELTVAEKIKEFKEYVSGLTNREKTALYKKILGTPDDAVIKSTIDSLMSQYEDKEVDEIIADISQNYANQMGYSEELIVSMLSGYNKEDLLDLLKATVTEMVIKAYEEKAVEAIKTIISQPSAEELNTIKQMVLLEMYSVLDAIPIEQQYAAKLMIQRGYIANIWASTTDMPVEAIQSYLFTISNEELEVIFDKILTEEAVKMYAQYSGMSSDADNDKKVAMALDAYLLTCSDEMLVTHHEKHMPDKISDVSYHDLLSSLGLCSLDDPSYINIYPIDFEKKENIADMISQYNESVSEEDKIEYTDIVAMLMSSVSQIINAISVVLICFVSISLIVSSIMIGIITYISVLERTKEIGILRAVGASKGDISRVFNAETMIVGLLAGIVGIVSTVLLCIPINIIARNVTGIMSLTAVLPWYGYLLIVLSVVLTLIAGLFPAMMAAKKDPVVALRTE